MGDSNPDAGLQSPKGRKRLYSDYGKGLGFGGTAGGDYSLCGDMNESAFVNGMDMSVDFDFMDSDKRSVMSRVNNLGRRQSQEVKTRFFGKSTKDYHSGAIKEDCIFSNIRNLNYTKEDLTDEVIFVSNEGTKFTKRDVYWVRRFQNAWRLRAFKNLTMKIVRQQIQMRKETLEAEHRRNNRRNLAMAVQVQNQNALRKGSGGYETNPRAYNGGISKPNGLASGGLAGNSVRTVDRNSNETEIKSSKGFWSKFRKKS